MRSLGFSLAISLSLAGFLPAGASAEGGLASRVAQLEAQVEVLTAALQEAQEILQFVRVETEEMDGLTGPHWIIEGANVHVQSGSGSTHEGCSFRDPDYPNCESLTGLGNLIVGYNERVPIRAPEPREVRTGSHNLVVGKFHSYTSFSGFVAGDGNSVTGASASVCGGKVSVASGDWSSVSGGFGNVASGRWSSVSGGWHREAPEDSNWTAGELFEPN